MSNQGLKRDF